MKWCLLCISYGWKSGGNWNLERVIPYHKDLILGMSINFYKLLVIETAKIYEAIQDTDYFMNSLLYLPMQNGLENNNI